MFGIGEAVRQMQLGHAVARAGWNGKGMYLFAVGGDGASSEYEIDGVIVTAEEAPYIMMKTAGDKFVPWLCSQMDLLATDWSVAHVSI